ncbi:MAG: hypothetical protein JSW68_08925 [Burkholderiales bacterium]|nr:MAG: hypothetical protein JSW68_08925 [Burkholderiales bacterium]
MRGPRLGQACVARALALLALGTAVPAPGGSRAALVGGDDAPLLLAAATAPGVTIAGSEPAPPAPAVATDEEQGGLLRGIRWELAPIRYWGQIAIDYRTSGSDGGGQGSQQTVSVSINGASYIWQPWFAQLRGGLGLVLARSEATDGGGTRNLGLTGSLGLSLLPISRFPSNFYLDVSDSRADGEFTGVDYRTVRFGFDQSYTPPDSSARYRLAFDQSTIRVDDAATGARGASSMASSDTVRTLRATYSRSFERQSIDAEASISTNGRDDPLGRARSQSDLVTVRHSYQPADALSIESLASLTRFDNDLPTRSGRQNLGLRTLQLSSFATWRPLPGDAWHSADHPLYLTANVRAMVLSSDNLGTQSETRSLFAGIGLNYQLLRTVRLIANTSLARFSAHSGPSTSSLTQSFGLSYAGDPIALGRFVYTHSASVSASLAKTTGADAGSRHGTNASLNHGLSRTWALGPASSFALSLGQGLSLGHGTQRSLGGGLTHSVAASWTRSTGGASRSLARVSATDSRALGAQGVDYQMVNVQVSQQQSLSRVSYWSGNLTWQGTRRRDPEEDPELLGFAPRGWTTSYGADLSYVHQRAFGVQGLRYTALLNANSFDVDRRDQGFVDAPLSNTTLAFDQRLEYRIGRLDIRLSARWARVDGKDSWVVFLRIVRAFGRF